MNERAGTVDSISEDENIAIDELTVHQELADAQDRRCCLALETGLENTSDGTATGAVLGALDTLVDHEGANAFEMAQTGILALIRGWPQLQEKVGTWHAVAAGCDPSQDAIKIVDLAAEVERSAFLYRAPNQLISPAGAPAVAAFRTQYLVPRFGERVLRIPEPLER